MNEGRKRRRERKVWLQVADQTSYGKRENDDR
jgi:hypothetical protein